MRKRITAGDAVGWGLLLVIMAWVVWSVVSCKAPKPRTPQQDFVLDISGGWDAVSGKSGIRLEEKDGNPTQVTTYEGDKEAGKGSWAAGADWVEIDAPPIKGRFTRGFVRYAGLGLGHAKTSHSVRVARVIVLGLDFSLEAPFRID